MRSLSCLFLSCFFLCFVSTLSARIIHVPGDSPTIQGGINSASTGDTVMVDPGTYYEHDIDFLGKAITVTGTDPEDSAVVAATVVDAESQGRVFLFQSSEDTTSLLSGLCIAGGFADYGGGIYCINSSPKIQHNIIQNNTTSPYGGGGIWCESSSATISKNTIRNNDGGNGGGGIYCWSSDPLIANNIIVDNYARDGGGIFVYLHAAPKIMGNLISRNIVYASGGGISISNNQAVFPMIVNNVIADNQASTYGGGISFWDYNDVAIINTILWDNNAPEGKEISIIRGGGVQTISYSDLEGGLSSVYDESNTFNWGEGMIDTVPLFTNNDYQLQFGSPCIDAGDPSILDACRPPGLGEERSDMGAYGGEENCGWPPYPPAIISSPVTTAVAGLEYYYDVDAYDPDTETLYYSLQIAPHWLSIDSTTGVISGIPPMSAIGDTTVTVLVEDDEGGSDDQTYPLTILPQVDLTITPDGPTDVSAGEVLYFSTHIQNYRDQNVIGDYWLSVRLPNSSEILIPKALLNYSNPLHGQVFGNSFIDLNNQLFIPMRAGLGSYQLIGRIGTYPSGVFDESSFGFQVVK